MARGAPVHRRIGKGLMKNGHEKRAGSSFMVVRIVLDTCDGLLQTNHSARYVIIVMS